MKNIKKLTEMVQASARRLSNTQERAFFYDVFFGLRPRASESFSELLAEQLHDDLTYLIERAEAVRHCYKRKNNNNDNGK